MPVTVPVTVSLSCPQSARNNDSKSTLQLHRLLLSRYKLKLGGHFQQHETYEAECVLASLDMISQAAFTLHNSLVHPEMTSTATVPLHVVCIGPITISTA